MHWLWHAAQLVGRRRTRGSCLVVRLSWGASILESWLDQGDELLEDGINVGSAHQFGDVGALFLPVLPVSLVVHFLELSISHFFDFIEVNVKGLAHEALLMAHLSGIGCFFWFLEAHKGIEGFSFFVGEQLDALNFSVLAEELLQLFLGGCRGEILDIEVASLLGVLVSDHVLVLLCLSVCFVQCWLAVHSVSLINLQSMEFRDSLACTTGTIVLVGSFFSVADKPELEGLLSICHYDAGKDFSILFKQGLQLGLVPFEREVLDVKIVEDSAEFSLVFGGKSVSLTDFILESCHNGSLSKFGFLVAHKSVSIGLVVLVQGDLDTHDVSVLTEFLIELLGVHVCREVLHKHVLVN